MIVGVLFKFYATHHFDKGFDLRFTFLASIDLLSRTVGRDCAHYARRLLLWMRLWFFNEMLWVDETLSVDSVFAEMASSVSNFLSSFSSFTPVCASFSRSLIGYSGSSTGVTFLALFSSLG